MNNFVKILTRTQFVTFKRKSVTHNLVMQSNKFIYIQIGPESLSTTPTPQNKALFESEVVEETFVMSQS